MGRLIREQDLVPDLILSSPAIRALKTAETVAEESGYEGEIELIPDFYPGDPETYIDTLVSISDQYHVIMIVGHNPGLEELLDALTGESARMPTSALAQVSLPIDSWADLNDEPIGSLINLWWVKDLD